MIFKNLLLMAWKYSDAICWILANICFVIFGFMFGIKWGILVLGISFLVTGLITELVASMLQKGGD